MNIDKNIKDAIDNWILHGLSPGSCTTLLLMGKYDEAFNHAHPLIKPHWEDHIKYIESLPEICRGNNFSKWKLLNWLKIRADRNKMIFNYKMVNKDDPKALYHLTLAIVSEIQSEESGERPFSPGDSCFTCESNNECKYAFDPYNTDGDCLMNK